MDPDVVEESVFSILEFAERVECKHGAMCASFNRNRTQLMQACQDFIQTVLKQLNVLGFRECYRFQIISQKQLVSDISVKKPKKVLDKMRRGGG